MFELNFIKFSHNIIMKVVLIFVGTILDSICKKLMKVPRYNSNTGSLLHVQLDCDQVCPC